MSEKTKFWILLTLLLLSIALVIVLNTGFNRILLGP
jgi:hypothetical protein